MCINTVSIFVRQRFWVYFSLSLYFLLCVFVFHYFELKTIHNEVGLIRVSYFLGLILSTPSALLFWLVPVDQFDWVSSIVGVIDSILLSILGYKMVGKQQGYTPGD